MKRVNLSISSHLEGKVLDYLVGLLPLWVTADRLTLVAFLSALFGGVFYYLSGEAKEYLLLVNLCLFIHWFADSLDGRVARFRGTPRPNYGFYIDHILDSISAFLFLGGLIVSSLTKTDIWTAILALMLISMVHAFLKTKTDDIFEISLSSFGPTEARLSLVFLNFLVYFFGNPSYVVFGIENTFVDMAGWVGAVGMFGILIPEMVKTAVRLDRFDTKTKK